MPYKPGDLPVPGYRLTRWMGSGQFGEVWEAMAPGGRRIALKIIDLRRCEGLKEFESLQRIKDINFPHLVDISAMFRKGANGQLLEDTSSSVLDYHDRLSETLVLDREPIELIVAMDLGEMNLLAKLEECRKAGRQGIPSEELLEYMVGPPGALTT